jgi:hypothetical protein
LGPGAPVRATTLTKSRHQGELVSLTADSVLIREPARWYRHKTFRSARSDLAALELGVPDRAMGAFFGALIGGITMNVMLKYVGPRPRSIAYTAGSIAGAAALGALVEAAHPHFTHWVVIPATMVMPGRQ